MKIKQLLTKTLLVAVGLLAGQSVWAEVEWQLAWADYFEDASAYTSNVSWSSTNSLTISQQTRPDGVSGKYYYVYDNGANGRTWTFNVGNAYSASAVNWSKYTFASDEPYKLEFDIAFRSDRFNNSSGNNQTFTIPNLVTMNLPKASTTATFSAVNAYAAGSIAAGDELFTINAVYDYSNTGCVFGNHFYHFVIEAGSDRGTALKVYGPYSEGAYSATPIFNKKLSESKIDIETLTGVVQRYYSSMGLDNVELYKEVDAESIETPTASITAVDGINRTVTLSCATGGVSLSYSTNGGESYTAGTSLVISENTTVIVKATKGVNSATSDPIEFEAGTEVVLNTPTTSVTSITQKADGLYYPTVAAVYNPAGVLLSPSATLTAKFNGEPVSLPYVASSAGTLSVTASYDGYTSSTYDYPVVGYSKVIWKDYTTLESLSGRPSGLRKWSGDSHWALAEGYGLEAVRTDGSAWVQIDRAGMVAYDVLSEASSTAEMSTITLVNNHNTGNDDLQYFTKGKVLSKIYYFTEGVSATISPYGYASFSSTHALDLDNIENAKAYIVANNKSGNSIKLQEVTGKVAAGTGLILKSNNGGEANVTIPVTNETGEYYNTNTNPINYLFALDGSYLTLGAANPGTNYVLTVQDDKVVFAPIGNTTAAVKAGQAALWLPASAGAKALTLSFADDITGINEVGTIEPKVGKIYYNLQGQRVSEPKEGIYVVEGKKVLVNKWSH